MPSEVTSCLTLLVNLGVDIGKTETPCFTLLRTTPHLRQAGITLIPVPIIYLGSI